MLIRGQFELEAGGKNRGFKFGILASEYFCEMENITLKEMEGRLQNPTPKTAINVAVAALRSYNESHGISEVVKRSDVADWLDEIGIDKFFAKIEECLQIYHDHADKEEAEKNVLAPM